MLSAKLFYRRVPDLKVLVKREVHKSYYDLLGLTPKASQTDIKQAYYKKSMVYHPDKGDGNPERFREITTAYEVLGNLKLRKLYDKGMLPSASGFMSQSEINENLKTDIPPTRRKEYPQTKHFYEKQKAHPFDESLRSKSHTGQSDRFNFDAWTQAHYSETFAKRTAARQNMRQKTEEVSEEFKKVDAIVTGLFFSLIAAVLLLAQAVKHQDVERQFKPKDK